MSLVRPGERVLVPGVRAVRAPARRDRDARAGRGAHDRGAVGAGVPDVGRRGGDRARCARTCSRWCRATRRRRCSSRSTSSARSAQKHGVLLLHGRDGVAGRQPVRDGRVGPGRRDGRAAEVPVGPVGQRADQPVRAGGRRDPRASPHRGRDPRGVRRGHRGARALQLLRPRHDPRLLGTAAAQPPHRGDEHAVRGARVRADHRRGGSAGRRSTGTSGPVARCSRASGAWGWGCSATWRTR